MGMMMPPRRYEDDGETKAHRAEVIDRLFRDWLHAWNVVTTGDDRVDEKTAGRLLGYTKNTLRNMRAEGRAPRGWRVGGKITYRVGDVVSWLASTMEEV